MPSEVRNAIAGSLVMPTPQTTGGTVDDGVMDPRSTEMANKLKALKREYFLAETTRSYQVFNALRDDFGAYVSLIRK